MTARSIIDKIWDDHVISTLGSDWDLIHIDRHLLHDLSGPPALLDVRKRNLKISSPELVFATPDHAVSSQPGRTGSTYPRGERLWSALRDLTTKQGLRFFDLGQPGQGIVHVMAPELGISLPGVTLICGDSHTCTNGGIGALAFGVGTSESAHALATSTLRMRKPAPMRIRIEGSLGTGVTAKDIALHLIRTFGADAGVGQMVEYAGTTIQNLEVESRLTLCNLSVELGARSGIIAPDEKVFEYVEGRRYAPKGKAFEDAIAYWQSLATDDDATFDCDLLVDAGDIAPTVTWGTSPEHAIAVDASVPSPADAPASERDAIRDALDYMGLEPGKPLAGTKIDWVFIGSCANSRLSDLREAAKIARDRRVADGVTAWVVPGSVTVKEAAEAEGLDRIFTTAGFEWREPGCSMCVAANGEQVPPGARCVSTSNRNFVGRQGPRARTHLASPASAAAAAVSGSIVDVRTI